MLFPNKVKYRKQQRGGLRKGDTHKGDKINFGEFGIISLEHAWMSERQIEAARIAINRYLQRDAKIWIRVFPDKPMTAKGEGVRMGKGKGAPEGWVAVIRPGRVMFEIGGTTEEKAKEAFRLAGHKLSVKTKFVGRVE